MSGQEIDWQYFEELALRLNEPGQGPAALQNSEEIQRIGLTANDLAQNEDWKNLLRFASLFYPLIEGESISRYSVFQDLVKQAMTAAEASGNRKVLAYLRYVEGHNLHRQGSHEAAIEAFTKSSQENNRIGESSLARKSYYMTALCLRALSRIEEAKEVLQRVLSETALDDPWRANPLIIQAWIARDENRLEEAEQTLREALAFVTQDSQDEILTASAYADLGEVVGLQGRAAEAHDLFQNSHSILSRYQGLYNRQEARVKVKEAELEIRETNFDQAIQLLNQADRLISPYGVFRDLLWKIEMLKAMIYVREKKYGSAMRKLRSAKEIYESMGLPPKEFFNQITNRLKLGAGFKKPAEPSLKTSSTE